MKKVLSLIVTLVVMMCAVSTASITFAHADAMEDECDRIFFETLNEIVEKEGIVTTRNTVTKELVYDLKLNPLGYIYYIDLEESDGFALAVNTDGIYTITEIYLDAEDPYAGYDGQKIYISLMFYAVWDGENFIETSKGLVIDPEDEIFGDENVFYGGDDYDYGLTTKYEIVYYTNRIKNDYNLALNHPAYLPVGLTNGCVPTAGANIIGYYTRFYPELIPGFEPGAVFADLYYFYYEFPNGIDPVLQTLNDYMGTNVGRLGTSIDGFKKGMTKYCNEKGRSISYNSCMKSGKFNYDLAKQKLESGEPSVVFVNSFSVVTATHNNSEEKFEEWYCLLASVPHAMAGFGYSEVTYTLSDGSTRRENYISVATGLPQYSTGYFNVNDISVIDDYYSIDIY